MNTRSEWLQYQPKFEYEALFEDSHWPWAGHKNFAYDLVRNLAPKTIVELGTHQGTSFFSMVQAVKDGGLNTNLYAVDSWQGDHQAGYYGNDVLNKVKKIAKKFYKKININLMQTTFNEASKDFQKHSIDLLHIDGLHTYDAVKHDFDTWVDKVSANGTIMFHDISEKSKDFGVYKLWEEISNKHPSWEFHHSHGLGIIFMNKEPRVKLNLNTIWQNYYNTIYKFNLLRTESEKITIDSREETANLTKQINEVSELNSKLNNEILSLGKKIEISQNNLNTITSSKYYKMWRFYCKVKDTLKNAIKN